MGKRRPSLSDAQLAFDLDVRAPALIEGALMALPRQTSSAVARILKDDRRSRYEVAGHLSGLLEQDVSAFMLDAWSSEAREDHNISFCKMIALIGATNRLDILDFFARMIGGRVIPCDEMVNARFGHLAARRAEIDAEMRALKPDLKPFRGGDR